jgi:hypothetical protein
VLDVVGQRLRAHHLSGEPLASVAEAVSWFGAVQAQDYPAAKWGLGQRVRGVTDSDIDRVFDQGAILRTHLLRPTWHFVTARDIRWIQQLTSPRVLAGLAGRHRRLELDSRTVARAADLFGETLAGGHFMTRAELADVLTAAGIAIDGQRLPHLIAAAEHANVITSGPIKGKQFTYALLSERAPKARSLDREEALEELTVRYFRSHGPAQLKDFGWWSGLTMQDMRKGIHLARKALERHEVAQREYWSGSEGSGRIGLVTHLLPNFDEFTVAYRDRSALIDPALPFNPKQFAYYRDATPMGGILSNVVTVGGIVRGSWSRKLTAKGVEVTIRPLAPFSAAEAQAVRRAAAAYGRFLGVPADMRLY